MKLISKSGFYETRVIMWFHEKYEIWEKWIIWKTSSQKGILVILLKKGIFVILTKFQIYDIIIWFMTS